MDVENGSVSKVEWLVNGIPQLLLSIGFIKLQFIRLNN